MTEISSSGDQFFPEGIAYNSNGGIFYTGSTINGDIVQVNVKTAGGFYYDSHK